MIVEAAPITIKAGFLAQCKSVQVSGILQGSNLELRLQQDGLRVRGQLDGGLGTAVTAIELLTRVVLPAGPLFHIQARIDAVLTDQEKELALTAAVHILGAEVGSTASFLRV